MNKKRTTITSDKNIIVTKKTPTKKNTTKINSNQSIFESYLCSVGELSLEATLDCGQCFRWWREDVGSSILGKRGGKITSGDICLNNCNDNCGVGSGVIKVSYCGIVCGFPVCVYSDGESVFVRGFGTVEFWRDYFDLGRDYSKILPQFGSHPFTIAAINFGRGLRVLKQDAWEMLCSYIISQNNNIPRISSSISKICVMCGECIEFGGVEFYKFPSASAILGLGEAALRQAGLGYRVEYLMTAARSVIEGKLEFDQLKKLSTEEARERLLCLRGVGMKVANCVLLFGLGKLDAFPVDTWIEKAKKYYDNNLNPNQFGQFAGIAQEYIFYYIRKGLKNTNQ
jgi:N-glycosylase/DNA lyase